MTRRGLALVLAATLAAKAAGAQQPTACEFIGAPLHPAVVIRLPSGQSNTFTGGGVVIRCPEKRIVLRADSVELYGEEQRVFMLGNVDYSEPRLRLTSDQLTYFAPDERVVATGRVNATLPSGSRLVGPQAEYRRAAPNVRTVSEMTATGRPTVTLVEGRARRDTTTRRDTTVRRDTPAPRPDTGTARRDTTPTVVTANTIFVRGDSLIYGSGQVDIRRPDLVAASDSVFLDSGREFMRLLRNPRIEGRRDRPYRLTGETIDVFSRNRQLERVVAKGSGSAVSEDMTLTADTIELRVASDLLQHAVAWGPRGAKAVSPTQTITADSITVEMPGQQVRMVTASREAFAAARPDTTRIETRENDWLSGDTIIARFDTAARAPTDTSRQPQIRQLLAVGDARSLYHLAPSDSASRVPAINYVTGATITVAFDSGRVARVTVTDQEIGLYLEPSDSTARAAPRSTTPATPTPGSPAPRPAPAGGAPPRPSAPAQRPPNGRPGLDTPAVPGWLR